MRTGGTLYLYINGVQKQNEASLGAWNQLGGDGNVFLGIRSGSTSEWMKGYMDEWRYSDNARYSTGWQMGSQFTPKKIAMQ